MSKSPDHIYDELLVLRCQDGDRKAFAELVGRWQPRLWRYARQLAGSRDAAGDVMQEAWMAIMRGLRGLKDPASFPKWAYRIVNHKFIDWTRRKQRQRSLGDTAGEGIPDEQEPVEAEMSADDDVGRLREAMRKLSADRRAILSMFYLDEMSIADISGALEIPEGTVKSRLHAARNQLRKVMESRETNVRERGIH